MNWQSHTIDLLTASLMRPFALAATAWLILRVFKVRHPASRHAVWMAVLIGMLLLPVVTVIAPRWNLALLPRKQEAAIEPYAIQPVERNANDEGRDFVRNPVAPAASDAAKFAWPETRILALWAYLIGLLAMLAYRLMGWIILRRVIARSTSVSARRLRESNDILTPVTVGLLRPLVILPSGWRDWQSKTKRAVLAHEFAHIRRHDTLLLSLTRLAKCVYWFHPLAWWISRQVSDLAELSCDAAALRKIGDPAGYSRILLDFATTVDKAGYRLALPGLAMASGSGMSRRVELIFELASGNLKRLSRPGALLVLAGIPVMCLAAVVELSAPAARVFRPVPVNIVPVKAPPPVMEAQSSPPAPPQTKPTPPGPGPKFEVASIKPCRDAGGPGRGSGGGPPVGRLHIPCMTADELIGRAWRDEGSAASSPRGTPIEGGPGWIHSDRYAIDAEADGNATEQTMWGPMMRALLEDRFQLKVHLATNDIPVYALTVAKDGPKLHPFRDGECTQHVPGAPQPGPDDKPWCGIGGMRTVRNGRNVTWDVRGASFLNFATFFSVVLDRPVVDRTGISGMFDFHLEFAPDETTAGRPSPFSPDPNVSLADPVGGPSIFTAFQQQLGLKLEPGKGTGEAIVIDRIERPSEN